MNLNKNHDASHSYVMRIDKNELLSAKYDEWRMREKIIRHFMGGPSSSSSLFVLRSR